MNFSQQQVLINNLTPLVNHSEFDQVFARATSNFSASERFQLKMEVKRLAAPCVRVIDLRGKVDGECREFDYKGQIHYLDGIAIERFKQLLKVYSDVYTMGIYEELHETENNFKVMQRNNITPELAAKRRGLDIDVPVLNFDQYIGRKEERVHLSSPITIEDESGAKISAMSSNLSLSGIRVRLSNNHKIEEGEHLRIRFNGLEQEFANRILTDGCDYRVLSSHIDKNKRVLGLIAVEPSEAFIKFFKSFLKSYRGRYRIDVENMTSAVQIKGYEQFYISQITGIPLYFDTEGHLKHLLRNRVNPELIGYWQDETENRLAQMLNAPRIQALRGKKQGRVLFYCFTHIKDDKTSYYAASNHELEQNYELQQLFWGFGSRKPSWRVYQFQWHHCTVADMAFRSALPQPELEQAHNMVLAGLSDINLFGMLTDITQASSQDLYQRHFKVDLSPNLLSKFNLNKHPQLNVTEVVHEYFQLRKEPRYLHESDVQLIVNGENYPCTTVDISVSGLHIRSQKPLNSVVKGDLVKLSLSHFADLVSSFELENLNYQIANINQSYTLFNLSIPLTNGSTHEGKRFLRKLIRDNKDKLVLAPEIVARESLSRALRCLVSQFCFNRALYLAKKNHQLSAVKFVRGSANSSLDDLFNYQEDNKQVQLNKLLGKNHFLSDLMLQLRDVKIFHSIEPQMLYVSCDKQGQILQVRQAKELETPQQIIDFIKLALNHGSIRVLELRSVHTGRPNRSYFDQELNYVSSYAIHKAKLLEEEIWSSYGLIEFVDMTDEILGLIKASNRLAKARLQQKKTMEH